MNALINHDTSVALMQASETQAAKLQNINVSKLGRIEEAAREFEAVFISEMMKPMFEGIETEGMFGGGQAEEMFRSLMLQEIGKAAAQTGQVGLSSQVKTELLRLQEEQSGTKPASKNTEDLSLIRTSSIQDLDVISEEGL